MPYGEKIDSDGRVIDFDKIYQFIIKQALESIHLKSIRCDDVSVSGWIHVDMFEKILEADIAIVDITSLNANVFYELGIRHALKPYATVLIRQKGTHLPFNIQGLRIIEYDSKDLASADKAKQQIAAFIQNGMRYKLLDSPVHQVLESRVRIDSFPKTILKTDIYEFGFSKIDQKSICLITGDIQDVRFIDVWVNSENTNMQMDRYYENSISGIVRCLGARKDEAGRVIDDTIVNELAIIMGNGEAVVPAYIVVTSSGSLEKTHGVKKIFHAASVIGNFGQGYKPIKNIHRCVVNALYKIDEFKDPSLKTILFPLMGTGKTKGNLNNTSRLLIDSAITYIEENQNSMLEKIFFLTYTEEELEVCRDVLRHRLDSLKLITKASN
jgi:hypothetical protein